MAKPIFQVEGVEKVQKTLLKAMKGMEKNNSKGILAAGVFIKGESQKVTPMKEGILVKTAFNKSIGTLKEPAQAVGFTAKYAAAVHEMPDDTNWNKPGTGNKFLENAVINNLTKMFNLIAKFASRKPI